MKMTNGVGNADGGCAKVVWSRKGLMGKKEPRAAPYSLVVVAAAPLTDRIKVRCCLYPSEFFSNTNKMTNGGREGAKVVWSSKGLMLMGKEPRAAPYSLVVVAAAPGYTRHQPNNLPSLLTNIVKKVLVHLPYGHLPPHFL